MSFFAELKRRNVLRVAGLYLVAAWLITQVSSTVLPMFDVPAWVPRTIVIVLAVGFVPALIFSWAFELTPQGFKLDSEVPHEQSIGKQTARRIDRLIVIFLLGVIATMLAERVWFAQHRNESAETETPRQSIAVLPFTDLSEKHDQEYFSDGMAEEILNALAKIHDLKVAGRTSAFSFKGKNEDLRTIGKALSVANVLEGSVRKQGDRVRITAQLIRSDDDFHVWSETYDGDMSDVFALQERIARAIAEKLQVSLQGDGAKPLVAVATTNTEAYSKFLVAQSLVYQRFGDSLPRAIALLQEATKLDPQFGRAWSKEAVAYAVLAQYVRGDWRPNWKASDEAAQRALAIDPNDAEAYAALSYNQFSQRHYAAMVEPMRRALALDPNNMTAIHWDGNELSALGRSHDSEARVDAGLANDPTNAPLVFYKAALRWRAGDTAGALAVNQRLQDTSSKYVDLVPAFIAAASGDFDEGARHFVRQHSAFGTKLTPAQLDDVFRGIVLDEAHRQAALKIVDANSSDDWAPTFLLELGEPERSFALFENGTTGLSDAYLNWLWQTEAWSRSARQNPAFQGFAQRLGMVDYWKKFGWPDLCKPAPEVGPDAFTCQ